MMSFSVDQFMQVKCKFQLTTESESSESIYSNNERIRLCASVDVDEKSSIIVMICSNDTGNNHIVAYYIGSRTVMSNKSIDTSNTHETSNHISNSSSSNNINKLTTSDRKSSKSNHNVTFTQFAHVTSQNSPHPSLNSSCCLATKIRPRIIVKQIYYHNYNEDIAAIGLSDYGNKLALISVSSTIYIIPIKNILLNLYAKQLRSSQGKSMYFYDASITDCCSISSPVFLCFWDNCTDGKSTIIVGNDRGDISFISLDDKKEINSTSINEPIRQMKVIRDRFSYSLLITSESFRQYRFILELIRQQELSQDSTPTYQRIYNDEYAHIEKEFLNIWDGKPIPIKLQNSNFINSSAGDSVLQRVFVPSSRANQAKIVSNIQTRERSLQLMFCHSASVLSIVDILRSSKINSPSGRNHSPEPRLLRFFSTKNYYYRPQKPMFVCRLTSLDNDEMITHVVMTDRFLAIATDKNRCLINSRNCCDMKNPGATSDLEPLVKEVSFNSEEHIMNLFKSPISNDQDGIIDSFLLVTNRSIYSIEARQSCRDMYVNLIDSHLSIKLEPSKDGLIDGSVFGTSNCATQRKSSDTNHMINSFLNMREDIYDRIIHDSRAFSALYKLALNSLYEAYADRLLLREQYGLANRFYQMATFSHMKILGKYLRLEWSKLSPEQRESNREIWSKSQESNDLESLNKISAGRGSINAVLSQLELFRKLVAIGQESQELAPKTPLGQHKQLVWNIFNEALSAYLDESTEDSCRLWFSYINFYLKYVGDIDELESDILELLGSTASDYRLAITLYKAVGRNEPSSPTATPLLTSDEGSTGAPLESISKSYNLPQLFKNEFLMRLLERTLDACESSNHSLCISCL